MQLHLISVVLVLTIISPSTQSDEVYCGEAPDIPFATLREEPSEEYAVGSIITYKCRFGYTTRGRDNTLECKILDSEQDADWTKPQFSCTPQSCGDPGYVNNGRRIGSVFTFPNSVKYECNEGYKLNGLPTRYCQVSGVWSGTLPTCKEVTCSLPRNLENGHVTYSTLNFGSELQYKCDKGFRLTVEETVFCTSDGKWSSTNVQCIETLCDMPQKPEHGSVLITGSNSKLLAGTIAIFSCDDDRIADGAMTSKCLETGEWTFPPPKCLEPCQIPYITNGIIGSYVTEGYYRKRVFKQKTVGSEVKDDELLYLRCADKYEILGSVKNEESVSCQRGIWSHELQCVPASCRNKPPLVQNAQARALSPEHGGTVLYLCDEDFKMTVNETIVCDFGVWKGNRPVCKNTRCSVADLVFPGIVKGRKSIYRHGEFFEIECSSQYKVTNTSERILRCEEGTWKGPLPPCVAASCSEPPPNIDHGQPADHSSYHSSIVKYTCEDPYILPSYYQVQCLFGEWTGQLPKCEDSRCYLKNLQNSAYVDTDASDSVTLSGNKLNVVCKEGYSPSERPICLKGKWTVHGHPCKESNCIVPLLYHGDIKEQTLGDYYWNWKAFRYDRTLKYEKIPAGTTLQYSSSAVLFCHNGYYIQGSSLTNRVITCTKGKWTPHPICLQFGAKYVTPTTTRKPYTSSTRRQGMVITTTSNYVSEIAVATTHHFTLKESYETVTPAAETKPTSGVELPEHEYFCEYPIDDEDLIAHADGKKLRLYDEVKDGSVVVFRCKHVGYHQLKGVQTIKCENDRNWRSSEFPTCSKPKKGGTVILLDKTLNVSAEGNLEARKGQDVKLKCVAVESGLYPNWHVPTKNRVTVRHERMERETRGDVLYITHLAIENADLENEGPYGCAIENNTVTTVNLTVNDPDLRCFEIPDVVGVNVIYNNERRVNSKAIFSCTNPYQQIEGEAVLTCKRNGEWSDSFPQCTDAKCRELKGNDLLQISYTNDRKVGSKATFHCFVPGKRSGASFADCFENRTWSNPTPTCRTPPCATDQIFSVLPDNVMPNVDNMNDSMPYNTTIKLSCSEDMIVVGEPKATCNRKGEWVIGDIQCISGCPELIKDSDSSIIILPNKDVYRLGETVTFSCPPGMSLTTESQRIMCLKSGWSETVLPDCE